MVRTSAKHLSAPEVNLVPIGAKPYRVALISTKPKPAVNTDLLGDEVLPMVRTNERPEAGALIEVLKALRAHPMVFWCERMNSGAAKIGTRFVRFGWPGCPDVLGQLKDGRLIGVECKSRTGKLRPEQAVFLERIRCAGGVAFIARDCRDIFRELDKAGKVQR